MKKSLPNTNDLTKLYKENSRFFPNKLSEFVYLRTYSRWSSEKRRREMWPETVKRFMDYMRENLSDKLTAREYATLEKAILTQQIMPSMRLMQFAGPAARATHVCAYNCAFIAPTKLTDFGEIMYILMCGTGVGFSVEKQVIEQLPIIEAQTGETLATHIIQDNKEGWCDALVLGLKTWYSGKDLRFDFSHLRKRGARLKTMGGKSSGPEPLQKLFDYLRQLILQNQQRRLSTLQIHDMLCKIGEVVIAGGVRRSAMISLSDVDDQAMRSAKEGQFFLYHPQRSIANNSAVYNQQPDPTTLLNEWLALINNGSGERGIFSRSGLTTTLPQRRLDYFKKAGVVKKGQFTKIIGTNPCGEIILQSKQFCNLSEIIARPNDTAKSLLQKIKLATILGTYQATLTDFPYLSAEWRKNCEAERLLGVSITGQWDCPALRNAKVLAALKKAAVDTNKIYAKRFGINQATAVTCVKPSGTVSQVTDAASGMHPRFAPYYMRRIRINAQDALFTALKQQGIPYHPETGETEETATTFVLEFPVKSPKNAICQNNLSALQQLEYWLLVKQHFTEHNPSVTIYVSGDEWITVLNWIYQHWHLIGGLSFLPRHQHVYPLAPYEAINAKKFHQLEKQLAKIDFSQLMNYEQDDETTIRESTACGSAVCET